MDTRDENLENRTSVEDRETTELDSMLAEAETLAQEGHFDAAASHLQMVVDRFPHSPLPHHALSVVYLNRLRQDYEHLDLWEDLANDEELFQLAVAEAEAALEIDETFLPARNNLGTLCAYRGWWDDAIQHWETSLSQNPDQPLIQEDLARIRERVQ